MKRQRLQISHPLKVEVQWYDNVPVPAQSTILEGEVIGWRDSQVIVRVKDYAVIRFWKSNGVEVGNGDYERRGYRVDLAALSNSVKPPAGVNVQFKDDGQESQALEQAATAAQPPNSVPIV